MSRATILSCVLVAACHGEPTRVAPAPRVQITSPAQTPSAMLDPHQPLHVEALGSPVRSARTWTSALVPNARGGWNFITQSWELGLHENPEYVVVDLEANKATVTNAPRHAYAVTKYQVRNQLRARNGRVFFPLSGSELAYYDPADETVKDVPPVLPDDAPDKIIYSATFGPDGMLYGGTQSTALPSIVQIDPDTLSSRVIGHVGRDRKTYSYAYEIAVDPPWIYAAVGELPWELAALNMTTGESRILATRADHGWMKLETRPEGVRAQLITALHTPQQVSDYVWCVDGKAIPVDAGRRLPFKARNFLPRVKSLPGAPELDVSQVNPDASGIGRVRWRAPGSSDWKTVEFKVSNTKAISIEALTALPDGSVLGGTMQYHGFFKTTGSSSTFLGGPSPSQSKFAVLDGLLYTTGYPNGVLYVYDPSRPWTGTPPEKAAAPGSNPRRLGNFKEAGAKYANFLTASQDRLYFAGRLERDGFGASVGYYEPATKTFAGHHDNLADVVPAGLAVLPGLQRVVLSERLRRGTEATQAELVVYDRALAEIERLVVKPGMASTGLVYASPAASVIVGVVTGDGTNSVYRYDIAAKKLLDWKDLPDKIEAVAQRSDGSLWVVLGTSLVRIDPATLEMVTFGEPGTLPAGVEHLVWQGDDLYASVDADLYRIARVGLP